METDASQLPASAREREAPLLHRITTVDLVFSCWTGKVEVQHLAAGESSSSALSVLVSLRVAYLAVLRVFGWLAVLARSDRAKDAEIRAPRTQLGVAM